MKPEPELSIVIPTLNEEVNLREILLSITQQQGVAMEVIVSDGGSQDATCRVARESTLQPLLLRGAAGRALQLNAGAAAARGEFILFLHADSLFCDDLALRRSLDTLCRAAAENSSRLHAGHFAIRFRGGEEKRSTAYRFMESKAGLNRKGCSHGDQGILIPSELFREQGGFDNSCQILSETRLADRLREKGEWLLLPAELTSSRRRFDAEGVKERQTLNALIMALGAAGQDHMLCDPALYAAAGSSSRLQLQPVFRKTAQMIASLAEEERAEFWKRIGRYVCENAWQIPFFIDVMLSGRVRNSGKELNLRFLGLHDRYCKGLADNRSAAEVAALAGRLWLTYMCRL